jgi:hypothetical protein
MVITGKWEVNGDADSDPFRRTGKTMTAPDKTATTDRIQDTAYRTQGPDLRAGLRMTGPVFPESGIGGWESGPME